MHDSMIDRVADCVFAALDEAYVKRSPGKVDEYVVARRILGALREPTDAMKRAGAESAAVWIAMIDAALEETMLGLHDVSES